MVGEPRGDKIRRARQLRQNSNSAEELVWLALRNRRLYGLKFRRQHPIGPYIADFICLDKNLIVEIDGETHLGKEADDQVRQQYLELAGYRILRVKNRDVYQNLEGVALAIAKACGVKM